MKTRIPTARRLFRLFAMCLLGSIGVLQLFLASLSAQTLLNEPIDVSTDFRNFSHTYYLADRLAEFDPATHSGMIHFQRGQYFTRQAFDNMLAILRPVEPNEFPANEYEANPTLPFSVEFVSPRALRIRVTSGPQFAKQVDTLMLAGLVPKDDSWQYSAVPGGHRYASAFGSVTILENPWHIEIRDASGKLLTKTDHTSDNNTSFTPILPFSFVRRASDYSRRFNAAFTLSPGEKIFGCGESFTSFDKRGQKIVLCANDANGVQNQRLYKPIPFFMSNRGYGMFLHTTTPITCDFGNSFSGINSLMLGDDELDLFVFLGSPKDILGEYTRLTGASPTPPLWSFGLWMSRCTYSSEKQVREVAARLRQNQIPCDVIHLDTGWFETDWRCDYQFSPSRFTDPQKMISDLKNDGFHISLWQLPYFVPKNTLFPELVRSNLVVRDGKGNLPEEDAVLDFSNPSTVEWYQAKLANLLKMGVGAIKVDFGEAAPYNGVYADGRTGFYEHNLYPLRYNKAVADVTLKTTGEHIIWARSAWAGSQRYPIHWGGDAESTDQGMAAELRGGLSLGLSGFSFWSHDIGGFTAGSVSSMNTNLYARWLAFGMLSSHSRCHGIAPREPWNYGDDFLNEFRAVDDLKYCLMPYVYAQARDCSERGLPMLRALFVEFPDDPGSWLVDDEYLFGSSILVAPLMHQNDTVRAVYLPPSTWIDYQTGKKYSGGWQNIEAGKLPVVMLVRDGTAIPQIQLAQSTAQMDWSKLNLVVFATDATTANGLICLPSDNTLHPLSLTKQGREFKLANDPLAGKVTWSIQRAEVR
ncbi:MAG TPA: TIM-barrel domain-containing protein [Verrucomicrobiae bacterium]|nr:TIM-barrel domain-containing protein [Verrucomicrobiae bacterium]